MKPECTDPETGQRLRLYVLGEIDVEDEDEKADLLMHGSTCPACGDILFKNWLRKHQ